MKIIYFGFVLLSILVVSLPAKGLIGEKQSNMEIIVNMPKFIIQKGEFHWKMYIISKGGPNEEFGSVVN